MRSLRRRCSICNKGKVVCDEGVEFCDECLHVFKRSDIIDAADGGRKTRRPKFEHLSTVKILELRKNHLTWREIAEKLNSKKDTVRRRLEVEMPEEFKLLKSRKGGYYA